MMTLRSILCAVDFSEQSRDALRWAGAFAAQFQSQLTILNVLDPLLADAARIRYGLDLATQETEPALREFASSTWRDGAASDRQATIVVRTGNASDEILESAADRRADLIVLGTQGLGGVRKWLLGSTTERVLRRAQTSVLAVPPGGEHVPLAVSARRSSIDRLMSATDFSASSTAAVEHAAELANAFEVPLLLCHFVPPTLAPLQWRHFATESEEARVADAREQLERLKSRLSVSSGCEVEVSLGPAAELIASTAEQRQAGLIVMGLTGAGDPSRRRPGSIAYRVLSSTSIPVLGTPSPDVSTPSHA
jgi:nucleotide-binding universal stress UspA family protein